MSRTGVPRLSIAILLAASAAFAGENDAPRLIQSARNAMATGDTRSMLRLVSGDRAAAYEAVFVLESSPDPADAHVADRIADAYRKQHADDALVRRLALVRSWSAQQRAAREEMTRLKSRGIELTGEGRLEEAREHFRRAIPGLRDLGDLRDEGRCLSNLGAIEAMMGNNHAALQHLTQARSVTARAGDVGMVVLIQVNEAYVMENLGDIAGAARLLEAALPAARSLGDTKAETAILLNYGSIRLTQGDQAEAAGSFRQAAELARKLGDAEAESAALFNLSDLEFRPGAQEETYRMMRRAIELARQAGLPRSEADAELKLSAIYRRAGNLKTAGARLLRAREVAARTQDPILRARVEIEAANLGNAAGEYARSLELLDQAEEILGPVETPSLLSILHSGRAVALYYTGEYEDAARHMEMAVTRASEASRPDLQAEGRQTRGLLLCLLGETSLGLQELEAAVQMHAAAGDTRLQATGLEAIGVMRFRAGDPEGGRASLARAMDLLGADGTTTTHAEILTELAMVDLSANPGARPTAIEMLKRAMDLFVSHDDLHGIGMAGPLLVQAYLDDADLLSAETTLRTIIRVARGRANTEYDWQVDLATGRVREAKGDDAGALRAYRESIARVETLRRGVGPALWRAAILEDRIAPYLALASHHVRRSDPEQAWLAGRAAKARSFTEQLAAPEFPGMQGGSEVVAARRGVPAELLPSPVVAGSKLRSLLAPDELLLDFFFTPDEMIVFVVTRASIKVTRQPLSRLPANLIDAAKHPGRPVPADEPITRSWNRAVDRLGPILFEGIGSDIAAARHLLIVPGGPLHGIPFAALRNTDRRLVDTHEISILPAAESLLSRRTRERPSMTMDGPVLAMGDPATAGPTERLPGAAAEAGRVAGIAGPGSLLAVGDAALEKTLRDRGAAFPRIHLAAHGRIDRVAPQHTFIALAAGGGEDGRLTALEIASLRLPIPLVVLSGCDTGVEEGLARAVPRADERIGLPRAFLAAGVGTVVAGLWEMEDGAANSIMPGLHERLRGGSVPRALGALQTDLIQGRIADARGRPLNHPFYWAALAVYGAGFGADPADSSVASAASARSVRKVEP